MHGKALVVDLSTKTTQEQEIPQRYIEQYIGGRGLGGRLLHDHVDPKVDPLAPENVLMFVSGPLNATRAFYSSKSVAVTKSPQSGTCLHTVSSGHFCHNVSKCGYDALILKGKSERLFISKAGFGRADDRLPSRLLNEPLPDGPNRGKVVPLEALKDEFYGTCGWDPKTGVPMIETLKRLGIELRP